jgi:starch synthase
MDKLLFVASEAYPLIKTGGLADVAGSLPEALGQAGLDVRLLLPAYADALASLEQDAPVVADFALGDEHVHLRSCLLPGTAVTVLLLDHPLFTGRPGNPYHDEDGEPWADNARRFALLSQVACALCGECGTWAGDRTYCTVTTGTRGPRSRWPGPCRRRP